MDKIKRKIYLGKIIEFMKNDYPLFKNMESYGFTEQLSEEELNYVLSGVYEQPVTVKRKSIYNQNRNEVYHEESNGNWYKSKYDNNGNKIYYEHSSGYWEKSEYDENGNEIYSEYSNGYWKKREYDNNGNKIYYENSNGNWYKKEYDEKEYIIYYEDSTGNKTLYNRL